MRSTKWERIPVATDGNERDILRGLCKNGIVVIDDFLPSSLLVRSKIEAQLIFEDLNATNEAAFIDGSLVGGKNLTVRSDKVSVVETGKWKEPRHPTNALATVSAIINLQLRRALNDKLHIMKVSALYSLHSWKRPQGEIATNF